MANNKFFTSPKGRASYPKLITPDTKFNAEGVYQTKLVVPKDEAEEFIEQIKEVFAEEFPKHVAKLQVPYEENEDGDIVFKFKSKNKPTLFNAAGKPVTKKDLKIGSGTLLKIRGAIGPCLVQGKYYATLWMNAVQIIDLIEYQAGGFKAEEGGFMDTEDEAAPAAEGAADASQAEDF